MEQMSNIFDMDSENSTNNDISNINHEDLPNPEDLHNHINGLLKGNLGKLRLKLLKKQ